MSRPTPSYSAADVLRRAAEVLDERGWAQTDYEDIDGCVCALGALSVVVYGDPYPPDDDLRVAVEAVALGALEAHLKIGFDRPAYAGEAVAKWNDAMGRTVDEVKAAFLAAAERAS